MVLNFYIVKKLYEKKELYISQVIASCIFILYMMSIVEIYTRSIATMIWFMFALAERCSDIKKISKHKSGLKKVKYKLKLKNKKYIKDCYGGDRKNN